jgi:hypothetical protein
VRVKGAGPPPHDPIDRSANGSSGFPGLLLHSCPALVPSEQYGSRGETLALVLVSDRRGLAHHRHRGEANRGGQQHVPGRRQRIAGDVNEPGHDQLRGAAEGRDRNRIDGREGAANAKYAGELPSISTKRGATN